MTTPSAVLVTGANSGIGRAVCRRFGAEGLHVYAAVREKARGDQLLGELGSAGVSAELLTADLATTDGPAELVRQVSERSVPLVAVVNNAGGVLGETSFRPGVVGDPELTYRVNVFAAYEIAVRAAELMPRGSIVNVSSVNAHSALGGARIPLYSSSKAALSHLTRMLAVKLAPAVRVNAVSPGRTLTEAWGEPSPEESAPLVADALINRWIEPDEIADAAWFLHRNEACTGVDLLVDGGMGLNAIRANV